MPLKDRILFVCARRLLKLKVLFLFVAVSVTLLIAQVIILHEDIDDGNEHRSQDRKEEVSKQPVENLVLENVQQFTNICRLKNIALFLIDPVVLKNLITNTLHNGLQQSSTCRYICRRSDITTFGVLSSQWKEQDVGGSLLSTHHLAERRGHLVHVVIFYERAGAIWWHGAISWDRNVVGDVDNVRVDLYRLSFGLYPGAYDRIDTKKLLVDGLQLRVPRDIDGFLLQRTSSRFVECNYSRAKHFYDLHPRDTSDTAMTFRNKVKAQLTLTKAVLDKLRIPFWLSSGTLLGK